MVNGRWPIDTRALYFCGDGYGTSGVDPVCYPFPYSTGSYWRNTFPPQCEGIKMVTILHYHPQMKLREGNVFTHVCDSFQGGCLVPGGVWSRGCLVPGGV